MIGHMMVCCVNEVLRQSTPHSCLETLICFGANEVLRHGAPHSHLEQYQQCGSARSDEQRIIPTTRQVLLKQYQGAGSA
jgi:hypothetical protein